MWPFKRKPKLPSAVSVQFCELADAPRDNGSSYSYLWKLPVMPVVGMRVWVRGLEGRSSAVIVGLGKTDYPATVAVSAIVSQAELDVAHRKRYEAETIWLEMMRKKSGLKSSSRRRKVPEGFPAVVPVDGDAPRLKANRYGNVWWRAYKLAESRGLPDDEVQHLASIAHRWYAIRDRG